ncbi:MAG: hypothetical protein HDR16_08825 [Lachnospiraceae bacterium]|nr:hypothetical protein [Lachnospiraceae bacterium]
MRAVHFMKIDYAIVRQQVYFLPIFYGIAMIMGIMQKSVLITCSYMLFIAVVFATSPFGPCAKKEVGFLVLLPSTVKDRVAGRFLYGLSYIAMTFVVSGFFMVVYDLLGYPIASWMVAFCLLNLAIGIFLMTLEFLFLYLFGAGKFNGQYLAGIVRTLPGMVMFFLATYCLGKIEEVTAVDGNELAKIGGKLLGAGVGAVAATLVILCAAMVLCVKVIEKRDYV